MFLANGQSLMGRTSSLAFLLGKGIGLNLFHHYLEGLLRKSKFEIGSLVPGMVALLTTLANRKVVNFSYLVGLLNNIKNPLQS